LTIASKLVRMALSMVSSLEVQAHLALHLIDLAEVEHALSDN